MEKHGNVCGYEQKRQMPLERCIFVQMKKLNEGEKG